MTKVSSLPQDLWHSLVSRFVSPVRHSLWSDLTLNFLEPLRRFASRWLGLQREGLLAWFVAVAATLLLMVWNGSLLFALAIGLGTVLVVRRLQASDVKIAISKGLGLVFSHASVMVAVGCGLVSVVASYLTLLIWQDTNSLSLACAILLQGLALITVLAILLWQMIKPRSVGRNLTLEDWVAHLATDSPLKRLMAIRNISHQIQSASLQSAQAQEISEYFQLLLQQESEPMIRHAILDGLLILNAPITQELPATPRSTISL